MSLFLMLCATAKNYRASDAFSLPLFGCIPASPGNGSRPSTRLDEMSPMRHKTQQMPRLRCKTDDTSCKIAAHHRKSMDKPLISKKYTAGTKLAD